MGLMGTIKTLAVGKGVFRKLNIMLKRRKHEKGIRIIIRGVLNLCSKDMITAWIARVLTSHNGDLLAYICSGYVGKENISRKKR